MPESCYYYRHKTGRRGIAPSTFTSIKDQGKVDNQQVLEAIREILSRPFHDYWGYHNLTAELKSMGYQINHKKVYRLMKGAGLLKPEERLRSKETDRKFVKFRKVETKQPLDCLEIDIKCVWIPQRGKNAYLLSLIDVHTRKLLGYVFDWQMKKKRVIGLLSSLVDRQLLSKGAVIRSDNGAQFIASDVRGYLETVGIAQEFTHIATPEENGHVEAYHGILKREVFDRHEYQTFEQIKDILDGFVHYYNHQRRHGGIKRNIPAQYFEAETKRVKTAEQAA